MKAAMYGTVDRIRPRPRWRSLDALAASMLALLGVIELFLPAGPWRRAIELGVTVLGFAAIHLWVRANRRELDLAGDRDVGFQATAVSMDAARPLEQPHNATAVTGDEEATAATR